MSEFAAPPKLHVIHVPGADPQRDAAVAQLTEQADVCLHADPQRTGGMATWLRAIRCAADQDKHLSWSVVVQDDLDPLRGWQQHIERACIYSPAPVLSLTHLGGQGQRLVEKGVPYGQGDCSLWGAAVAYHRSFVPGLADWAERTVAATGYKHDDRLIAAYALKQGTGTAFTARALFDLLPVRSLLGHSLSSNRPTATITSMAGPAYSSAPRSARHGCSPIKEIRELASHA